MLNPFYSRLPYIVKKYVSYRYAAYYKRVCPYYSPLNYADWVDENLGLFLSLDVDTVEICFNLLTTQHV